MKVGLFIVGAPKSGTTSLYHYLKEHPEICMSKEKELDYFSHNCVDEIKKYYKSNPITNYDDYLSQFESVSGEKVFGEGSVSYLFYPNVANEIREYNSEAKIIIMLRNPIDRAYSHYLMDYKLGLVSDSLEEVINQKEGKWSKAHYQQFIELGLYYQQVKRYIDVFGRENVHVIEYESFKNNTAGEVRKVFGFVNVDDTHLPNVVVYNRFMMPKRVWVKKLYSLVWFRKILSRIFPEKGVRIIKAIFFEKGKPKLSIDLRKKLLKIYEEDIAALEVLLKLDLSQWKR